MKWWGRKQVSGCGQWVSLSSEKWRGAGMVWWGGLWDKSTYRCGDAYTSRMQVLGSGWLTMSGKTYPLLFLICIFCCRQPVWNVVVSARPQFPAISTCNLDICYLCILIHHCNNTPPCWSCIALYQVSETYWSFRSNPQLKDWNWNIGPGKYPATKLLSQTMESLYN